MTPVPAIRVRSLNDRPPARDGEYALYWMIAARRTHWNFALDHAVNTARRLGKPLVVFEPLRCDYRWASDRLHRFVIEGMRDNQQRFANTSVRYYPYVEPMLGAGRGLLSALARRACVVVTDDFPCFFLPRMVAAAASKLPVAVEAVDGNGLLPLCATEQVFTTAHSFRRYLHKNLPPHLLDAPRKDPLGGQKLPPAKTLPSTITRQWRPADLERLLAPGGLDDLPIDHAVGPAPFAGGSQAAAKSLTRFLSKQLDHYIDERNDPDADATSGLSPFLHFGHISAHEVFARLMHRENWTADRLAAKATGSREGWWGAGSNAEAFLDQLITWRELGYNFASHRADYDRYESLPAWAQATLAKHARDRRATIYTLEEFAAGATHDRLWNAAQNQLREHGRLHNYLRMLWGKKILEWSLSPQDALETMITLNDKYAVDGRDPNSYSGILWVLGRYDRAWGPERPIFGKIRYMSSANTARKVALRQYLERFAPE
jgi:deoxyribodipyrimidine photo-lyase